MEKRVNAEKNYCNPGVCNIHKGQVCFNQAGGPPNFTYFIKYAWKSPSVNQAEDQARDPGAARQQCYPLHHHVT